MIERDPRLPAPSASALHGESATELKAEAVAEVAAALFDGKSVYEKSEDRHGRRPAWLIAMITMGVLVGGVAIVFLRFVNGPVVAGAIASTPTPTTKPAAVKLGSGDLGGLYFEMTYPAIFDQLSQLKNDPQALEQYYFTSKAEYSRSLAVTVRTLESSNYEDDASYKFRLIHPADYKERKDKMNGEPVAIMMKTDNTEATLFWGHKGKLLTVSVVSTKPADSVADFMASIEPKLRWKS